MSYFEIYGGRCQDLLNSRERLNVREDGNGEVVVSDLMEIQVRVMLSYWVAVSRYTSIVNESFDVPRRILSRHCMLSLKLAIETAPRMPQSPTTFPPALMYASLDMKPDIDWPIVLNNCSFCGFCSSCSGYMSDCAALRRHLGAHRPPVSHRSGRI